MKCVKLKRMTMPVQYKTKHINFVKYSELYLIHPKIQNVRFVFNKNHHISCLLIKHLAMLTGNICENTLSDPLDFLQIKC